MMNIINRLIAWFNNSMTMSYEEILFVEISKLN